MLGTGLLNLLNQALVLLIKQANVTLQIVRLSLHATVQIIPLATLLRGILVRIQHKLSNLSQLSIVLSLLIRQLSL
jgi:hypothetical protein